MASVRIAEEPDDENVIRDPLETGGQTLRLFKHNLGYNWLHAPASEHTAEGECRTAQAGEAL